MSGKNLLRVSGLMAVSLLAGCAVGKDYQKPAVPEPIVFANVQSNTTAAVEMDWWRGFQDPILEELISQASTNNHDLRLAESRLREARALWTSARFDFAPTVRSENYYENTQASKVNKPNDSRRGRNTELYRVGFDATWELDLWGRVRRNVEAARATVESVAATRDDVLVSVRAEVAVNYMELRGTQAQLAVAQRNATNQMDTLKLAEALRDGGQGTQFDVARARSLLNATLATIPPLEAALDQISYRLAVLCGQLPTALREKLKTPTPLPKEPANIALGNPAALIRRRPDIRAAERSLAAVTAQSGVAVADYFPRVTFNGNIGLQAASVSGFSEAGAETWSFGPRISWAALDMGRVRQNVKAADARAEGAVVIYEQTVLLALEEVESSLVALTRERQRLNHLHESERAAAEAVTLARQRYSDGIADFLGVLDAERTLLSLQDQLTASETRAAANLVAVYKALGGGIPSEP